MLRLSKLKDNKMLERYKVDGYPFLVVAFHNKNEYQGKLISINFCFSEIGGKNPHCVYINMGKYSIQEETLNEYLVKNEKEFIRIIKRLYKNIGGSLDKVLKDNLM